MRYIVTFSILFTITAMVAIYRSPGPVKGPIRILKLSSFQEPEEIGAAIFRRFLGEIQSSKGIVFASSADVPNGERVWMGFVDRAAVNKIVFNKVYNEIGLKNIYDGAIPINNLELKEQLSKIIYVAGAGTSVFHINATFENFELLKGLNSDLLIIFQGVLPLEESLISAIQQNCLGGVDRDSKSNSFNCLAQSLTTERERNNRTEAPYHAVVNQVAKKLFVLFINEK